MAQERMRHKATLCRLVTVGVIILLGVTSAAVAASEKWSGVDEAVIGKFAKEHGREARQPLIDTDHGDMLLFVFLLAGAAGGFLAGYYWRKLIEPGAKGEGERVKEGPEKNRKQPLTP